LDLVQRFRGASLTQFLDEIGATGFTWLAKRLAGNDTGLTGGHQAGLYLPKAYASAAFPSIMFSTTQNPEAWIERCFVPDADIVTRRLRVIYYNSKKGASGTRDEIRITRFGGRQHPVQDPENTGALIVFAVTRSSGALEAVLWVASSPEEEALIEAWLGDELSPGQIKVGGAAAGPEAPPPDIPYPREWADAFPSGQDIFEYITRLLPRDRFPGGLDDLLLRRRGLEYDVFRRIERIHVLPTVQNGFDSVESFARYANSFANRRKARTGASLELHLAAIFSDEGLQFERNVATEGKKRPDFLFPSSRSYHDAGFPTDRLRSLAAKTCCKDRWRQAVTEADRIQNKHLFTLQQGVSANQLQEMAAKRVVLVIPEPFRQHFPPEWRSRLLSLQDFVGEVKALQRGMEPASHG